MNEPYRITMSELEKLGRDNIPNELLSSKQLIYSSPATLAFNSPGATGYGVKRAGLAVPESIMLLVAPGCCGRNTRLLREVEGYDDRFFFLLMDEADIVSGKHLERIPQAIQEILNSLDKQPSVVMICSTCVDALLGTDWDRVCRKAEEIVTVPVRACYMYALTREGRMPPMVLVRKTIFSLLEKEKRNSRTTNIIGYFSALEDNCELYDLLKQTGIRKINEIARCKTFEEYKDMSKANFNLIVHPEARSAADDLEKRLGIPYLELTRLYQIDKIHTQYMALAQSIQAEFDDTSYLLQAQEKIQNFIQAHPNCSVNVGEMMNANSFELALALCKQGIKVPEIYTNPSTEDYVYIRHLAKLSPDTLVYTNLSPTMLNYNCGETTADLTIGKDAAYYQPDVPNVSWDSDKQPFGYAGLMLLYDQMSRALE